MSNMPDYLTYTHTNVVVGGASTLLLAANTAGLKYVLVQNLATDQVYIKVDAAAVVGQGIQLPQMDVNGNAQGAFEMSPGSGGISLDAIYGIAGGAGRVVLVTIGTS